MLHHVFKFSSSDIFIAVGSYRLINGFGRFNSLSEGVSVWLDLGSLVSGSFSVRKSVFSIAVKKTALGFFAIK